MVPVRFVAQALNCQVDWDDAAQTVIITSQGYNKNSPPANNTGQINILINGRLANPDVAPQTMNGRIMVPVRLIAEALGANVKWDDQTQTVIITGLPNLNLSRRLIRGRIRTHTRRRGHRTRLRRSRKTPPWNGMSGRYAPPD